MNDARMNITELEKGTMRLFASRTGAKDVVTIEGSVLGGYNMLPREKGMVPRLAAALLDAGTKDRDKDAIREALSKRGASVHFSRGGDRTYFSATCLPEDVDFILTLVAECLGDSVFPATELVQQKKRTLAQFNEAKSNTNALAAGEFSRLVFDPKHVNYADPIPVEVKRTESVTRKDLVAFGSRLGKGGLVLAITGDIRPDALLSKAERIFSRMDIGTTEMTVKQSNKAQPSGKEVRIPVADKANIDMFMGVPVALTYDSPEYLPFIMLTDMLGGRGLSGGHLMRTIRERDGLTYGINASVIGLDGKADGALRIWATFSPDTYEKAVEATRKEIAAFLKTGITEDALNAKKSQLAGKYVVGLGTTGGLASMLHHIGVEGKPLSYIDEYTDLVSAVTLEDLHSASRLAKWDAMSVAAAGTFKKK